MSPAQYERIRDGYVAKGMDYDKAQSIAAATYNKRHPGAPMTGHDEKRQVKRKLARVHAKKKKKRTSLLKANLKE